MANLRRYEMIHDEQCNGVCGMNPCDDGPFVKFADIAEALKPSHNTGMDAIALVCELGKAIDEKADVPLWAYRNQARIRTVCIAQQHHA